MIYYLTHIKDILGNNYLGIDLPNGVIDPFLNELKDIIGDEDYKVFTENQQKRDHGGFHMTVINVMDYNRLSKEAGIDKFVNSLDPIFKYPIDDMKMLGVGTAARNENRTFYIVCQSDKLEAVRKRYDLPEHDFHITLGFKFKDVFGVRKNEVMKKEGKFLKLLAQEFYKNNNWNFIKRIGNYDLDPNAEIIPVEIKETTIKFKCDGYFISIGYMEDGEKFWMLTKSTIDEDMPRLSETEIVKTLNKK